MPNTWMNGTPPMPETQAGLASDLAHWLSSPVEQSRGWLTWENIEFRNIGRPDVYAIGATLNRKNWRPRTYEVKVSVADFQADVRAGKWKNYLTISSRVFFAVPEKIMEEIQPPLECGLIIRLAEGWVEMKSGSLNRVWEITENQWMNLCLKARNQYPWELDNGGRADG